MDASGTYTERFQTALELTQRKLGQEVLSRLDIELTKPQYFMLYMISRGNKLKQTQLAEKLGVKPSAITVMIDRLVQPGYVIRKHDEQDRRVVLVELTEEGCKVLQKVEALRKEISAQFLAELAPEELETFVLAFEKISKYSSKSI